MGMEIQVLHASPVRIAPSTNWHGAGVALEARRRSDPPPVQAFPRTG